MPNGSMSSWGAWAFAGWHAGAVLPISGADQGLSGSIARAFCPEGVKRNAIEGAFGSRLRPSVLSPASPLSPDSVEQVRQQSF